MLPFERLISLEIMPISDPLEVILNEESST
jgi:hypothetical protein